ncbi:hypothetical protein [Arenibacterium sp. CAU 1754]
MAPLPGTPAFLFDEKTHTADAETARGVLAPSGGRFCHAMKACAFGRAREKLSSIVDGFRELVKIHRHEDFKARCGV